MRFLISLRATRSLAINGCEAAVELPVVSVKTRMLLDYARMQKEALAHQRRSIDQRGGK
jgi:hypothetical protein